MQSADHGPWTGVQASEELVGRRACRLQAPMALVLCAPAPAPVPGVLSLTPTHWRLCLAEVSKALPAAPASPRGQRGGRQRPSCRPRLAAPGRPATGLLPGHTSARSSASQGKQPEPAGTVTQCCGRGLSSSRPQALGVRRGGGGSRRATAPNVLLSPGQGAPRTSLSGWRERSRARSGAPTGRSHQPAHPAESRGRARPWPFRSPCTPALTDWARPALMPPCCLYYGA